MPALGHFAAYAYVAPALLAIYRLPAFGRSILAFLRDLDAYRTERPKH
ncbi:MAG TPA: hypothetical protein VND98_06840 [Solirubrobacterales bacterium]|nr:hypothetical protein [Solirubrobacterales bacterium]